MRFSRRVFRIASLFVLLGILCIAHIAGANSVTRGEQMYEELRDRALKASPADLRLRLDDGKVVAFGILMDIGRPNATATLTSFVTEMPAYISAPAEAFSAASAMRASETPRSCLSKAVRSCWPRWSGSRNFRCLKSATSGSM